MAIVANWNNVCVASENCDTSGCEHIRYKHTTAAIMQRTIRTFIRTPDKMVDFFISVQI